MMGLRVLKNEWFKCLSWFNPHFCFVFFHAFEDNSMEEGMGGGVAEVLVVFRAIRE